MLGHHLCDGIAGTSGEPPPLCRAHGLDGVPWYTIRSERFSADFGVGKWFGFNVFLRDGNDVYRTYFLQHGAMVQWIGSLWSLWSLTPYGGQGNDEDSPEGWPQAPGSFWFRRHDEFDEPPPSARRRVRPTSARPKALHGRRLRPAAHSGCRLPAARLPVVVDGHRQIVFLACRH